MSKAISEPPKVNSMLKFDIITIFPDIFTNYFNTSIIKKAQDKKKVKIKIHNLRKWAVDKHKTVDDKPYGGGPGMIVKADIVYKAVNGISKKFPPKARYAEALARRAGQPRAEKIILLTPAGKQFNQKTAYRYSKLNRLILICGRYEGVDARVEKFVDEQISIGPYVLTGGELPTMTIVDAVTRLIPGVIRKESLEEESFSLNKAVRFRSNKLELRRTLNFVSSLSRSDPCASDKIGEYPQYTRPENLTIKNKRGKIVELSVPKILLSGNHQKIKEWRIKQMVKNK